MDWYIIQTFASLLPFVAWDGPRPGHFTVVHTLVYMKLDKKPHTTCLIRVLLTTMFLKSKDTAKHRIT